MANCTECKEKRAEEAVREMKDEHSNEWSVSKQLAKSNDRWFIISMTILALWIVTIFAFLWYLNQYDYADETITVDSQSAGNAYYSEIVGDGNIDYGENNGKKEDENK